MINNFSSEKINKFCDNIHKNDPLSNIDSHNVYLLQTIDMDGNITNEAYGINLMTNVGFKYLYTRSSDPSYNVYIGKGDITKFTPSVTNAALFSPISTTASTDVDQTSVDLPFTYNSVTNLLTVRTKVYYGYFGYNLTGITDSVDITEIGCGSSVTDLYTHAFIYNENGVRTSITKNINERLYITIYWATSIDVDIIKNATLNDSAILINPSSLLQKNYPELGQYLYTHIGNSFGIYELGGSRQYMQYMYYDNNNGGDPVDNIKSTKYNIGAMLIESKYIHYEYTMLRKYVEYNSIFNNKLIVYKPIRLSQPEEIISYDVYTDAINSLSYRHVFGHNKYKNVNIFAGSELLYSTSLDGNGVIPALNMNVTGLSMYNHITKEWDIQETFTDTSNIDLTNSMIRGINIPCKYNDIEHVAYIYFNDNINIAIDYFRNTLAMMIATDTYWDISTWQEITDVKNIPVELQKKRYYIIFDDSSIPSLFPHRVMNDNLITNVAPAYWLPSHPVFNAKRYFVRKTLSSELYGWVMFDNVIMYPMSTNKNMYSVQLYRLDGVYTDGDRGFELICYNRWSINDTIILTIYDYSSNTRTEYYNRLRLCHMTNDPTIEPTYSDLILPFKTTLTTFPTYTFSDCGTNGYLVCQHSTANEFIMVNIHGDEDGNPVTKLIENAINATAIFMTSYCIYQDASNQNKLNIYDMLDDAVIDTFEIPSEYTIIGIVGWKQYIYIRVLNNTFYSLFVYDMESTDLTYISDIDIPLLTFKNYNYPVDVRNHVYNDDVLILNGTVKEDKYYEIGADIDPNSISWMISLNDPLKPIRINQVAHVFNATMRYVNNGKQLLMACHSFHRYSLFETSVIDIGLLMDYPDLFTRINHRSIYYCADGSSTYDFHIALMGNGVVAERATLSSAKNGSWSPIECWLQHKLVCTTKTFQAYNNPKLLNASEVNMKLTNLF